MDLSINDLRYFEMVARTRNISRASERLGISQPALSVALRKLEGELGVSLLIRGRSGVELTHAGRRLIDGCAGFLNDWKRLRDIVVRGEEEVSGLYVIGCHPSVALYSLPQILPRILAKHPVEIRLEHDLSRRITESVISFRIDFGIVVNPLSHPDLVIRPLAKDSVTLFQSAHPSPLQDVRGDGVLIYDSDLIQSQSIVKQFAKFGFRFKRFIHSSSLEVITRLVASGAGIGILPGRVAASSSLVPVRKAPTYEDKIALVYRVDRQSSTASRRLAREIETHFKLPAPR